MNGMIWMWLGCIVLFAVVEALTAGLVSIWFVAGAVVALVAAALDASMAVQVVLFLVASGVALAATRPLVRKWTQGKIVATNADRVLGLEGKITETVDNENAVGAVYVDGKTWTARSADGAVLPVGEMVVIERMAGVKLFVKKIEKAEVVTWISE